MTRIKVKTTNELFRLLASGIITADEWRAMVRMSPRKPLPKDGAELTLKTYASLNTCLTDYDFVQSICTDLGQPITTDIKPSEFIGLLATCLDTIETLENLFRSIPEPTLTAEEYNAGFGNLNFGIHGLIDRIARRQGITDEQAENMSIGAVIFKLNQDAKISQCQRRLQQIYQQKAKSNRR